MAAGALGPLVRLMSEGSDEAKRLGGQCPLLLKPRGGADSEGAR